MFIQRTKLDSNFLSSNLMISFLFVMVVSISVAAIILLLHSQQKEAMADTMKNSNALANSVDTKSTTDNSNFLTYKNFAFGILIQYPSTWGKIEPEDESVRRFSDDSSDKQIVEFKSPLDESPDKHQVSLSISVHNLHHSSLVNLITILDQNQNTVLKSFTLTHLTTLSTKLPGFEFIKPESTDTTLAASNNPAHEIIYTYRGEPESSTVIKAMDALTIRDDKGYIIKYSAAPVNYSYYLPIIQRMMHSFNTVKEK